MEILVLVILIVINGLFAMSEIALITARRARLSRLAEDGDHAAAIAIKLGEEPTRFLSTIQIGITSIGILTVSSVKPHLPAHSPPGCRPWAWSSA